MKYVAPVLETDAQMAGTCACACGAFSGSGSGGGADELQ
jgi:hypothetical protein